MLILTVTAQLRSDSVSIKCKYCRSKVFFIVSEYTPKCSNNPSYQNMYLNAIRWDRSVEPAQRRVSYANIVMLRRTRQAGNRSLKPKHKSKATSSTLKHNKGWCGYRSSYGCGAAHRTVFRLQSYFESTRTVYSNLKIMNDTVLWGVASGVIKRKSELPRGAISERSGSDAPNVNSMKKQLNLYADKLRFRGMYRKKKVFAEFSDMSDMELEQAAGRRWIELSTPLQPRDLVTRKRKYLSPTTTRIIDISSAEEDGDNWLYWPFPCMYQLGDI